MHLKHFISFFKIGIPFKIKDYYANTINLIYSTSRKRLITSNSASVLASSFFLYFIIIVYYYFAILMLKL